MSLGYLALNIQIVSTVFQNSTMEPIEL